MSLYHESQDAILRAEHAMSACDYATAASEYAEAARMQKEMVDGLPPERVKTRRVFRRSYRSLYRRALHVLRLARRSCNPPGETG